MWASSQGLDSLQRKQPNNLPTQLYIRLTLSHARIAVHTPDSSVEALEHLDQIPDIDDLTPRKGSTATARASSYRKPAPPLTPPQSPRSTRHDPTDPFRRSGEDDRYASASRFTTFSAPSSSSTASPRKFASRLFSPRARSRSRASAAPSALGSVQQEAEEALADSEWQLVDANVPADVSNDLRRALGPSGPPVVSGTLRPSPGVRARRKLTSKKSDRALEALRAEAARMMSAPPMPPPIAEEGTSSGEGSSSRVTLAETSSSRTSGPRAGPRAGLNGLGNNGVPLPMHVAFDGIERTGHTSYGSSGTETSAGSGVKGKARVS